MNTSHLIAVYASRFRWFFFCFFFGCFGFDCLLFCSFVFFGLFSLRIRAKDRQKTQLTPLGESLPQTYALPCTALAYPRPCLAPYLYLCFFDVIMWFHNRQIYIFTFDHKTCSWFEYTYTRTHIYTRTHTWLYWQWFHISKLRVFVSWEQEQQQQQRQWVALPTPTLTSHRSCSYCYSYS